MRKKRFRLPGRALSFAAVSALLIGGTVSARAAAYRAYTYSYATGEAAAVEAPLPFLPEKTVDLAHCLADGSGVESASDFCRGTNSLWYIADSGGDRVLVLNEALSPVREVRHFGDGDGFAAPESVCLLPDGRLCVSDTGNGRLVLLDEASGQADVIDLSGEAALRSPFLPVRAGAGADGQIYAISRNDHTGIVELDENGAFLGYIGSTDVVVNWVDRLWKRIMTEEQKDKLIRFVPVEYTSLSVDGSGFIFAVSSSETEKTPVRRLNPMGTDVLARNGYTDRVDGDADVRSALVDVCPGDDGSYYVLDSRLGHIFAYDRDGELLYAFGDLGGRDGTPVRPVALHYADGRLYVLDAGASAVLVYAPTTYAQDIRQGLSLYHDGRYAESVEVWQRVSRQDANSELAYAQIGKALLRLERYDEAMRYFRLGNYRGDRVVRENGFNKALTQVRRAFLMRWWWLILIAAAASIVLWRVAARALARSKRPCAVALRGSRFAVQRRFARHLLFHPFDGFWDMKREKKGSMPFALSLLLLWLADGILRQQATGFLFTANATAVVDPLAEVRRVLILFLLFTVGNWSVTTLMGGEGSFRDIAMTFCYATLPLPLIGIPLTLLSNVLTYDEAGYVTVLQAISVGWFVFLLFFGLMTVHGYTLGRATATAVLTLAAMGVLMFIAMACAQMFWDMARFIAALFREIALRS